MLTLIDFEPHCIYGFSISPTNPTPLIRFYRSISFKLQPYKSDFGEKIIYRAVYRELSRNKFLGDQLENLYTSTATA